MEREIQEATVVLVDGLERRDVPAAVGVYADEANLLTPTFELMQGRAAIEAYWSRRNRARPLDREVDVVLPWA